MDNAINHISKIIRNNVTEDNLKLIDRIWLRLGRVYLKRTQNETSFRNEVQLLMDNCCKQEQKEDIAKKYMDLFCKKSDTAKQYVQKWMPIVAASQSVKGNAKEREFLVSWASVVDYQ